MTPDNHESQHCFNSTMIYWYRNQYYSLIIHEMFAILFFTKTVLVTKFLKILSLKNYQLYGMQQATNVLYK